MHPNDDAKRSAAGLLDRGWGLGVVGAGLLGLWWGWVAIGCVSLEQIAPEVGPDMVALGATHGAGGTATLQRGRTVYVTRCIGCHSLEPVDRYSLEQWQIIVPEMAAEAKLTDGQTHDLTAYLLSAHRLMKTRQAQGSAGPS